MANGELSYTYPISLPRMMIVLKYIGSPMVGDDVWYLAYHSGLGSTEIEDGQKTKIIQFQ